MKLTERLSVYVEQHCCVSFLLPVSYLFFYESYGVLRVSLLCLFGLCDSIRSHFPQRVFSLVAELFGKLAEVLSVFPCYSAGRGGDEGRERRPKSKTEEKNKTEKVRHPGTQVNRLAVVVQIVKPLEKKCDLLKTG